MDRLMHLPDDIRTNQNFIWIMDLKAERLARKHTVGHRVRLCEQQLQALRNELSEADRDLQQVENGLNMFFDFIQRASSPTNVSQSFECCAHSTFCASDHSGISSSAASNHGD